MTGPRITSFKLRSLMEELTPRYTTPLPHLAAVRLLSGAQLDRLLAEPELSPETVGRVRRRIMTRLAGAGLVAMLGRRIGGVRAGSAGHVYTLTTAGHRFLALRNGQPEPARKQPSPMPGDLFLTHTLTISGVYVDLVDRSHRGGFDVHSFVTEPHCWYSTVSGGTLRPDAYVILRTGNTGHCWWLEIDNGTEIVPRLRAKVRVYSEHFNGGGIGPDGVPPRLLFTTPDAQRADLINGLLGDADDHISATTHAAASDFLISDMPSHVPSNGDVRS
jgi:Replication-relaxation